MRRPMEHPRFDDQNGSTVTMQADPPTGDSLAQDCRQSKDRVDVTVPADSRYVPTVRLAAAGLAARCDLTIDEIEDLRLAVD